MYPALKYLKYVPYIFQQITSRMLFKIIFKNKMLFKIEDNKRTDLKYEETDVK
jgi:hypothetical protein